MPLTPDAIARDSRECQQAGCFAVHVHPRDSQGQETLLADACEAVVRTVRASCPGLLLGFSSRAGIEPDWERRLDLIRSWRVHPDFISVNFWEPRPLDLSRALSELGIGVEAGLSGPADAEVLLGSGLQPRHVLVEISEPLPNAAVELAAATDQLLDKGRLSCQRFHHGYDLTTWRVIAAAVERGHSFRVGLEDTLLLPDGRPARDNLELIQAALSLLERAV
ncbi:MAG: 3-keto-5-aminohexanoate cleavage protein [Candidatus Dormibacteraeota bacterium]|nr:3-keto-5-aminohexanoate cleavage protein [Candidatus Dormibacteraeota bacterium]